MGVDLGPAGQGGKRNVNAELNLIPFIDLLSVCILFLLMTAVWVEISKMSAFSQAGGETVITHSDVSAITNKRENRNWDVLVTKAGVEVIDEGISLGVKTVDEAREIVTQRAAKISDRENFKVALRASDDVIYENVIQVLDILSSNKIFNVTIGGI